MIKFFRKIRYDLMEKNKTGKYFKYAIGEIILVVIGILIALQINNLNENRKERIREQVVLKQLKEDYKADLSQLLEKMSTREKILVSGIRLLKAFDKPFGINRDSIIKDIAVINNDPTFDPIQNNLSSSGNLMLISNRRLNHLLSNWSSDVVAVQEIELIWADKAKGQLDIITSELGIGRDLANSFLSDSSHLWLLDKNPNSFNMEIGNSKLGAPANEILTDKRLESIIASGISLNRSANIQSEALRKRILEILDLIETEIKN